MRVKRSKLNLKCCCMRRRISVDDEGKKINVQLMLLTYLNLAKQKIELTDMYVH